MKKKQPYTEQPLPGLDTSHDKKYIKLLDELLGDQISEEVKAEIVKFVKLQCQMAVDTVLNEEKLKSDDKGSNK